MLFVLHLDHYFYFNVISCFSKQIIIHSVMQFYLPGLNKSIHPVLHMALFCRYMYVTLFHTLYL